MQFLPEELMGRTPVHEATPDPQGLGLQATWAAF